MIPMRRAFILPVVLLVLVLLGLLVAIFSFRVHADVAATQVSSERLQTRLAAEAGIERVKLMLRDHQFDTNAWYHNPADLHRVILWMNDGDQSVWGSNDEFKNSGMTYRFSIVADDPIDDENYIRFGLTDESSKLNLNTATEAQLLILVRAAVGDASGSDKIDPADLVDAILDWRDADSTPRGPDRDTEGPFYRRLPQPYRVRNGPFATVEELLLVKGVTGRVLYGEDFDRNGLLTDNEDDGDEYFPPDNEDGQLNRGLYPYLTVLSTEDNVSMDNRARIYLWGDEEKVRPELESVFPDEPNVVEFLLAAANTRPDDENSGDNSTGNQGDAGDVGENSGRGAGGNEDGEEGDESDSGTTGDADDETEKKDPPPRTPASLLRDETSAGVQIVVNNPLTLEHLPLLIDKTTMIAPTERTIPGLININTAPRIVLRCIDGLSTEQVDEIIAARASLSSEEKETPAWLVIEEIVDLETFDAIASQITARGQQFMIESLGYADHVGMVTRLQVVVDVVGPIVQTIYYRDMTKLSGHYPIREEDLERLGIN